MLDTALLDILIYSTMGLLGIIWLWILIERTVFLTRIDVFGYATEGSLQLALTRYMTLLTTVTANAPYVGLLGTVVGIMVALYDVGMAGNLDPGKIMVGLALALKATAMGISLAIVGMASVNLLMRRVDVLLVRWQDNQVS